MHNSRQPKRIWRVAPCVAFAVGALASLAVAAESPAALVAEIVQCRNVDVSACPALQSAAASRGAAIAELAKVLADSATPAAYKGKLAQALATLDARDHVDALDKAANALPDSAERVDVRVAQARLGDGRAAPDLEKALQSKDLRSQLLAVGGVGLLHDKAAGPALVKLLADGTPGRVQAEAARSLGSLGEKTAVAALLDLAGGPTTYPPARAESLRALALLGATQAHVFSAMLADHASRDVANAAMTDLSSGWQSWTGPAVLIALDTPGRRGVAARLAAERLGAEAAPKLLAAVKAGDSDAAERSYVFDAVALVKPQGGAGILLARLAVAPRDEKIELFQVLPKVGDRTVVPDLVPYLASADNGIVSHAVYALENLTNQRLGPDMAAWRKYAGLNGAKTPDAAP